jgi:hypothetical protein
MKTYSVKEAFKAQKRGVKLALSCGEQAVIKKSELGVVYLEGVDISAIEEISDAGDRINIYQQTKGN